MTQFPNFEHTYNNFKLCTDYLKQKDYGATLSEKDRCYAKKLLCEMAEFLNRACFVAKEEDCFEDIDAFINDFDSEEDLYSDED